MWRRSSDSRLPFAASIWFTGAAVTTILVCCGVAGKVVAAKDSLPFEPKNPSMTDGADQPEGWSEIFTYTGKVQLARDNAVFASGPAALRLSSVNGAAKAQVMQFHDGQPGMAFRLSGKVKGAKKATAVLGVQAYDEGWQGLKFTPVGNALPGLDWQTASGNVVLPEKTRRFAILLMLEGDGEVWLDDLQVEPVSGDAPMAADTPVKPSAPPKAENAWSAAEGFYPDFPHAWRQIHESYLNAIKQQPEAEVLYFGDSLTQSWPQEIWRKHFAPLKAINLGIGGDATPQVLWRIEHGELAGISPKVIVVMIGVNNIWPGYSSADTAKGIAAIHQQLREKQPESRILLLGVLPIFDAQDGIRDWIKEVNAEASRLADGTKTRFLDLGPLMIEANGDRKANYYNADRLHLELVAYQVLAPQIAVAIQELLIQSK